MGDVKVKVRISNLLIGPSPDNTTQYKHGQEFICSEEEAEYYGTAVTIVEQIIEPGIVPEPEKEKLSYKK